MINLFRHSNPISLLLLLMLACFTHFLFPYPDFKIEWLHDSSIFSVQFNELFGDFFAKRTFWNGFFSTIVILIEAFGLNKILSDLRIFEKSGFLPALAFIMLSNLIPCQYQGQMLLVNGALLLSFYYIISSFKKEKANGTILLAGFFAGVAAGFNNNFILFLWLTISLFSIRQGSLREWLLSTIGFILPFYFMISILYLLNKFDGSNILQFSFPGIIKPSLNNISWLRFSLFLGISFLGFIVSIQSMRKLLIQSRKTLNITYYLFFATLISCLLSFYQSPYNLYIMTVPASILIISIFTSLKKQFIPNLLMVLMILLSMLR